MKKETAVISIPPIPPPIGDIAGAGCSSFFSLMTKNIIFDCILKI